MGIYNEKFNKYMNQPLIFFKWLLFACVIGSVVGAVAISFYYCLQWVSAMREHYSWLIYLLPLGGAVIVYLYRASGMKNDKGTNFVLIAVREDEPMALRTSLLVYASTLITHLLGGSAGREGAILQIGGSISSFIGRRVHLDEKDARIITMCGLSAGFSALFGTPLTAAVFSMEMISVGVMYYSAIVPCVLSALIGAYLARLCGVMPTAFVLTAIPEVSLYLILRIVALGILCAFLSVAFCKLMHLSPRLYKRYLPNPYIRAIVGGSIVIAMTVIIGSRDYNGAGGDIIAAAISGSAKPEAFALKIIFTMVTLGAGFKGGEIVPVFFTGATFGCVVSPLIGLNASFGAAVGLVSVFCGVTNCPMTSILLAMELFGAKQMPMFALAIAVSYMLSGYYSLYTEQKILYSKLHPTFIDRKAK